MREFEQLGKFMKTARTGCGITQHELAKAVKVHSQFVSNWERGRCAPPSHSFQKLIKLLQIDRNELMDAMVADSKRMIEVKVYKKTKRKSS